MLPCFKCGHRDRSFKCVNGKIRCKAMYNEDELINVNNNLDCPIGRGISFKEFKKYDY